MKQLQPSKKSETQVAAKNDVAWKSLVLDLLKTVTAIRNSGAYAKGF